MRAAESYRAARRNQWRWYGRRSWASFYYHPRRPVGHYISVDGSTYHYAK